MRIAMIPIAISAALLICPAVATALESRWELRGRIGGATVLDEVEGADLDGRPGLATSGMVMWGSLLGKAQRWGICAGGGLFLDGHRGVRSDLRSTYTARGIEVTVGGLYQLDEVWHCELRALGRHGQGRLRSDDVDSERDDYSALGVVIGGFHTFASQLQLGTEASWLDWDGDSSESGDTLTANGDGLSLVATIGYRF